MGEASRGRASCWASCKWSLAPLHLLRTVAGALFLAVMLGSCAENVGAWLDIGRIVHIGGDPALWWPARVVAAPALQLGLVLWAALLALMADPPREAPP